MQLLASRNVSALVSQFDRRANVTWTGQTMGLTGIYIGAPNIRLLLNAFLGRATSLNFANATQTIMAASNQSAIVNSSFRFTGQSQIYGNFTGTVRAQDLLVYSRAASAWQIAEEIWNFLSFDVQYPVGNYYACSGPSCPQYVQDMAISEDGKFLAAGTYQVSGYGSVYLVSLQNQSRGVVWKSPTDTTIWSVAISSNGSYVAAGGFVPGNPQHGHGEVYLFDKEGKLSWKFSAGSSPRMVKVAIAANGSRVVADYGSGIIYLDAEGKVLWNQTLPQGRVSSDFAVSSDGKSIAYTEEKDNATIQVGAGPGWGIFDLDSQGRQLWSYTENRVGVSFVKMSSDGSRVVVSSRLVSNGSLLYFDGRNGALIWKYPFYPENGIAPYMSLAMSSDGSYIASGGPSSGILVIDSTGKVLWEGSVGGFGEPVLLLKAHSLILTYQPSGEDFQLVRYNGTLIASLNIQAGSVFARSSDGSVWAVAGGLISNAGGCATVHLFNGSAPLPSIELCVESNK